MVQPGNNLGHSNSLIKLMLLMDQRLWMAQVIEFDDDIIVAFILG